MSVAASLASGRRAAQVTGAHVPLGDAEPGRPPERQGAKKFAEIVAQKSGGKMQVKLFPGGVLGGDVQGCPRCRAARIEMTSMNTGILQGQSRNSRSSTSHSCSTTPKEADAVVDGPIGKALADKLPEKGLVGLAYWDLGFRNVTNSKRPDHDGRRLAGLKIRVIQSPIYIDTFNALGANAVPMPFAEVYTALEQKTVDGQENPFTVIAANKFNEVQKYLTVTRHIYNPQSILISKKTWDRLNEDEQKVLLDAAKEAQAYQRKVSRDAQDVALANLKKTMEYSELPPAELAKIRTKLKPVIDKYSANVGADFAKQVFTEIEKVRGEVGTIVRERRAANRRGVSAAAPLSRIADVPVRIAVAGAGMIGLRHIEETRKCGGADALRDRRCLGRRERSRDGAMACRCTVACGFLRRNVRTASSWPRPTRCTSSRASSALPRRFRRWSRSRSPTR